MDPNFGQYTFVPFGVVSITAQVVAPFGSQQNAGKKSGGQVDELYKYFASSG